MSSKHAPPIRYVHYGKSFTMPPLRFVFRTGTLAFASITPTLEVGKAGCFSPGERSWMWRETLSPSGPTCVVNTREHTPTPSHISERRASRCHRGAACLFLYSV